MPVLLIASTNPGKVAEFRGMLAAAGWEVRTPVDLGLDLAVAETGATFLDNAVLKARAFAAAGGLGGEARWRPALAQAELLQHVVHGDVAEVQVGREATRDFGLGLAALVGVIDELAVEEERESALRGFGTAASGDDTDCRIDGERAELVGIAVEQRLGDGEDALATEGVTLAELQ